MSHAAPNHPVVPSPLDAVHVASAALTEAALDTAQSLPDVIAQAFAQAFGAACSLTLIDALGHSGETVALAGRVEGDATQSRLVVPLSSRVPTSRVPTSRVLGEVQLFRTSSSPFDDDDRRRAELLASHAVLTIRHRELAAENVRDVNEARALASQLRQAQKMEAVGRLAGGVAHDFNNLLSVIMSAGDFLSAAIPPGDPRRDDVDEIVKAAARAAGLTRQLLAFSRQEVAEPKHLDLNRVLAELAKMMRRMLGEDIELVWATKGASAPIFGDPHCVEQVVMNLVVNARDAMPTGGSLTIETSCTTITDADAKADPHRTLTPGDYVVLSVIDTGIGMDEDTQARIFEPFFTTKEPGKGTGLGLSTVFGIVTQSRGTIQVESKVGAGTTFRMLFPRVDPPSIAKDDDTKTARGTETILLVEDEDQVRAIVFNILKRSGYNVLVANTPVEALALCEMHKERIDLLLSDVVMPRMSGAKLATRLIGKRPGLKVLCMSGYTDDSIVRHGVLDGAFPFIPKPFTASSLTRKLREVLDSPQAPATAASPASGSSTTET